MGVLSSKTSTSDSPLLEERLKNAKLTGRLRLIAKDKNFDEILASKDLQGLKGLDMSKCGLVSLPHMVTNLTKLQQLKLNDNDLLVSLPLELAFLKDLKKLECTGCKQLCSLEKLPSSVETLLLSGCNFQGELQHPILSLSPNVITLDLSFNPRLTGFGPAFGFELLQTKLIELNLNDNPSLKTIPPEIALLSKLLILKVENCPLIRTLPSGLFEKTMVSKLELRGSGLTKSEFMALPKVELFMERRKAWMDREIAGGVISVDLSVCGLD